MYFSPLNWKVFIQEIQLEELRRTHCTTLHDLEELRLSEAMAHIYTSTAAQGLSLFEELGGEMSSFTEADTHMMEESGNGNQLQEKCQKVIVKLSLIGNKPFMIKNNYPCNTALTLELISSEMSNDIFKFWSFKIDPTQKVHENQKFFKCLIIDLFCSWQRKGVLKVTNRL